MNLQDRIVNDPEICHGKATIRGTRVMVSGIIANLAAGHPDEVILRNFPALTRDDLRAVVQHMAKVMKDELILTNGTASG